MPANARKCAGFAKVLCDLIPGLQLQPRLVQLVLGLALVVHQEEAGLVIVQLAALQAKVTAIDFLQTKKTHAPTGLGFELRLWVREKEEGLHLLPQIFRTKQVLSSMKKSNS